MERQQYLVALGSNVRHPAHGAPRKVLRAALAALGNAGITVRTASPIIESLPVGPSRRRYANGAALVETTLGPPQLLAVLQGIERDFGRRRMGSAWRARVLDLDIILWRGGIWNDRNRHARLIIPHPAYRNRPFVLGPARHVVPAWADAHTGLRIKHHYARLTKSRPAPR